MKRLEIAFLVATILAAVLPSSGAQSTEPSVTVRIDDAREVVTRRIGTRLLLRISKDRSVDCDRFGWIVEVVRRPARQSSPNLVYRNPSGHGADPSQVYAWHVAEGYFPNRRELPVRGYPYTLTLEVTDTVVRGTGPDACFVTCTLTVSWARR